jgi:hypothetical protein
MDREKALGKIQKLMAMAAADSNASETEVETALRQAESLMRKFAIDMAEALQAGKKPEFDWQQDVTYFGKGNKSLPLWYQWMAVAVAKFTDTIVIVTRDPEQGAGVMYRGHSDDVVFATWLIDSLKDQLRRATRDASCGSPENRETFRKAFGKGVYTKIEALRKKRDEEMKVSHGTALIVVNTKLVERDAHFGGASYKTTKARVTGDATIYSKGYNAGKNAQVNKPITHQSTKTLN